MDQEFDFEKSMTELETIVQKMESGNLSLNDSIRYYEEGMKLAAKCSDALKNAEKRVSLITTDTQGEYKEIPFTEAEK